MSSYTLQHYNAAAALSDSDHRHSAAGQVPINSSVVVSPVRISEGRPTMLRPLTDLGSSPPLSPTRPYCHPSPRATGTVSSPRKSLKKPKRPLTAYHIYFQIEREFIIQTMAGEDADKSIHEGKIFFNDVPTELTRLIFQ